MICSQWVPNLNEDQLILKFFIFDEDVNLEEDKMLSRSIFIITFLLTLLTCPGNITLWISSIDSKLVVYGSDFQ
jgi:hypothetical protein